MSSTAHGPVPTAKRQSCDRCHDQKLRCTRSVNSHKSSPCDRCLRKGAPCVYGHSLPKGRPSLYRLGESISGSGNPPKPRAGWSATDTSSTTPSRRQSEVFSSTLIVNSDIPTQDRPQGEENGLDWSAEFPGNENRNLETDVSCLPNLTTSGMDIWATLSDNYSQSDLLNITPISGFGLEPQSLTHLESSQPALHVLESISASNDAGLKGGNNPGLGHIGGCGEYGSADSNSDGNPMAMNAADSFQLGMTHLSQLSMRLTHLLSSSRRFLSESFETPGEPVNQGPALQVQAGVELVFKSIHNWLVCETSNADTAPSLALGPTRTFDLLHHAFSASDRLLKILSRSSGSEGTSSPGSLVTALPSPAASSPVTGSYTEAETMRPAIEPSQGASLIIHHLVLACITLLLNIYESILTSLQRCVDTLQHDSTSPDRTSLEPSDTIDISSRTHLQLVSVVQMCSYFIGRQNQTLNTILSSIAAEQLPQQGDTARRSTPSAHAWHLMNEVERRLKALQESLQIVS